MTVSCGRLRPCSLLDWKFTMLSHNTIRGAAGAALLNAELLKAKGYLDGFLGVPLFFKGVIRSSFLLTLSPLPVRRLKVVPSACESSRSSSVSKPQASA